MLSRTQRFMIIFGGINFIVNAAMVVVYFLVAHVFPIWGNRFDGNVFSNMWAIMVFVAMLIAGVLFYFKEREEKILNE